MSLKNSRSTANLRVKLATFFVEQQEAKEDELSLESSRSLKFGRYIRNAREAHQWTRQECAQKAKISETDLYYLEKGLIPSYQIEPELLYKLAAVLEEKIAHFECILNRELSLYPKSKWQRLLELMNWADLFFYSTKKLIMTLGVMALSLFILLLNLLHQLFPFPTPSTLSIWPQAAFLNGLGMPAIITAVTILMILLWVAATYRETLFIWLQTHQLRLLASIILILLTFTLYIFPKFVLHQVDCYALNTTKTCDNEILFLPFLLTFGIVSMTIVLLALFNKHGRPMIRHFAKVDVQRKFVYLTVMASLLMPLGVLIMPNNHTPLFQNTENYQFESELLYWIRPLSERTVSKPPPAPTDNLFLNIFADPYLLQPNLPNSLTLQPLNAFIWQNKNLLIALVQLISTTLLYAILGITILRKGKQLTAYSRN